MLKPQRSTRRLIVTTALLASSFLFSASAQATHPGPSDNDFVTTWNMPNDLTLTFPGVGAYTIHWGDDNDTIQDVNGPVSLTYQSDGLKTIRVSNTITGFNLANHDDAPHINRRNKMGNC